MHMPGNRFILALVVLPALLLAGQPGIGRAQETPPAQGQEPKGWNPAEQALIQSLSLSRLPPEPTDPSNHLLGHPEAEALGQKLFFDPRLSRNQHISCASCHQPERAFTDGLTVAQGLGTGLRNTPSLSGAAWQHWFFCYVRKDSLWSQALAPLETPEEHGLTRTEIVSFLLQDPDYRPALKRLADDAHRLGTDLPFPALPAAMPGGTVEQIRHWKALDTDLHQQVDYYFALTGKAIAAFVSTLRPPHSRVDTYAEALAKDQPSDGILSDTELQGLRLFIGPKAQCINCHSGPLLTNQDFHNIGTGLPPDAEGRAAALNRVRFDRFNCLGAFSDAGADDCRELQYMRQDRAHLRGSFKTPGLRNVSNTAPYFHHGQAATLEAVLAHYLQLGKHPDVPPTHAPDIDLTDTETAQLIAFLKALAADTPALDPTP